MGKVKKKKKKSALPVVLVVFVTILLAAGGLIFFMSESGKPSTEHLEPEVYFGLPGEGEKAIVTSGEILGSKGIADYGTVYILYEDALAYINHRMYYDPAADILTVTTPEEILNITPDDTIIGKAECARKIDGALYISASFLATCTDIEVSEITSAPQVVIRTDWSAKRVSAAEAAPMRQFADVKSPIIRDLRAGEVLIILAEEEHWTKAETTDGYIGYVENAVIGAEVKEQEHVNRIGEHTSISYDFPINMVFHQTDSQASNNALEKSLEGTHGINVIAPTWFFMDDVNGSFTDLTSSAYVEKVHSLGMKVWAVANDFDGAIASPQDTKALMEKTTVRQQLAENIVNRTLECGADGINLDFENVRKESAQTYLMFVREMSVYCRKAGLVLSIDSYVPQPYNLYLNRTEQAEAVDYIVTMAYDEHTSGSPEAGSVSSISWVKQAAEGTRAEVPDGKIIIALPFYTRIWETDNSSEKPATRAMGMREAEEVLKEFGMKTVWDETTQQDYAELTSGLKRQIWLENARSLRAKLELLKNYQFAGTAAWKLGLETPDIWDLLSEYHGS